MRNQRVQEERLLRAPAKEKTMFIEWYYLALVVLVLFNVCRTHGYNAGWADCQRDIDGRAKLVDLAWTTWLEEWYEAIWIPGKPELPDGRPDNSEMQEFERKRWAFERANPASPWTYVR